MAILKCKMCGGDLIAAEGKNVAVCDSCGTQQTLPSAADEQKANLFNRANHFRRQNDFDKAVAAYERILNTDDTDAEAHWGVVLSRYGIEYVEDPTTHEHIPTCHRVQFESILTDADYLAAVEHAPDGYTRSLYEAEAKRIAEIQKEILAISGNEKPYDVFICYKETSESGTRTKDSAIAQDVYYHLKQEGYQVFFSRITLEDKLGQQYEPSIFAALNSARVMVVIGTSAENFSAVWVKNEWSRYLALMKKDRSRLLIPCYRDMDAYDLPEELSMLQSQDMGKIGFIQDLIRGIKKVLDTGITEPTQSSPQSAAGVAPGVTSLLERGKLFLEDGDFKSADEYFDKVLDIDPKCAEAYWGKLLALYNVKDNDALASIYFKAYDDDCSSAELQPQVTLYELSEEQKNRISELKKNEWLNSGDFDFLQKLHLTCDCYEKRAVQVKNDFINSKSLTNLKLYKKAVRFSAANEQTVYKAIAVSIDEYIDKAVAQAKEHDSYTLEQEQEKCSMLFEQGISELNALIPKRIEQEQYRIERERQAELDRIAEKKKTKKLLTILIPAAAVVIAFVIVLTSVIIPGGKYNEAAALMEEGDYNGAMFAFGQAGNYKDARERSFSLWAKKAERHTISAGDFHTVGLKSDGTVVAVGSNEYGQCDVSGWRNIVAVSEGDFHTVGLKSDGTVVAVGSNKYGKCDVSGWRNIVAVSAGDFHTVGLKSDGTVVAVGSNEYGKCDVSGWTDIKAPGR